MTYATQFVTALYFFFIYGFMVAASGVTANPSPTFKVHQVIFGAVVVSLLFRKLCGLA
jgi:hypothetical protein